jgi:hypothetical protein
MVLIQEPWYHDGCVSSLNIPVYTLYSAGGKERPRTCILARNMNAWELPGFCCRDLVSILVKLKENMVEIRLFDSSCYLPFYSEDPPPSRELEELVRYRENENLYLLVECDSNAHHTAWSSTNCKGRK